MTTTTKTTKTRHWKAPDPASYTVVDGDEWEDLPMCPPGPTAAELLVLSAHRIGVLTAQLARYSTPDPTLLECAAKALYHQDDEGPWDASTVPEWVRENYRRDARAVLEAVAKCNS